MQHFSSIGLVGRSGNNEIIESLTLLINYLHDMTSLDVVLEVAVSELLPSYLPKSRISVCPLASMQAKCDLVIVVGGDGSMLEVAPVLAEQNIPVVGVNRGRLGFLTDIVPTDIEKTLAQILKGDYKLESRFLLEVCVETSERNDAGQSVKQVYNVGCALNDVVLHPGIAAQMIEFELFIDDEFVYHQASDGLIVATPTGSTAYSMSAGGPIMHPGLDALLLVPMYPHSLSSRPAVIGGNSKVSIVIEGRNSARHNIMPQISCDGTVEYTSAPGDRIIVTKKAQQLTLVHPVNYDYYETCRSKLGWSHSLI